MSTHENEPYRKVLDLEYESLDGDEYEDWETGEVHKDGLVDHAKLLAMRKRLAAAGRQALAEFYEYMVGTLDLSKSTAAQTISRVTVAYYETGNKPWRKLEDWRLSDSYYRLLHTDLRKLAAWMQLTIAPDGAYQEDDPNLEEMVQALLESRFWWGGSRYQLLERYLVRRIPERKKGKRLRGAPQPPRSKPAPPQEPLDTPDTSETVDEPEPEREAPRTSSAAKAAPDVSALPEVLVIDEVARLIGVGRNKAYELYRDDDLPGGRRIGSRLIRFGRDAILERVGLPIPVGDGARQDTLRMAELADLLRVHMKTLYQLIHDGEVALPDRAWVTRRPAVFSRRVVLEWLSGKGRDHGSWKERE
jgi:predicted DNA-binding transcriptional regulator AlpA